MPVPAGPSQPRHLDAQRDPDPAHRHLSDEFREARPGAGDRRANTQIVIDHADTRAGPAQRCGPPGQRVLQPGRFLMLDELPLGRLADVDDRRKTPMLRPDLPVSLPPGPAGPHAHRAPPRPSRPQPWPSTPPAVPPAPPGDRPEAPSISRTGGLGTIIGHPGPPPISLTGERNRRTRSTRRNNASRLITTRESDDAPDLGASCVAH